MTKSFNIHNPASATHLFQKEIRGRKVGSLLSPRQKRKAMRVPCRIVIADDARSLRNAQVVVM